MNSQRKIKFLLAFLVITTMLLAACQPAAPATEAPAAEAPAEAAPAATEVPAEAAPAATEAPAAEAAAEKVLVMAVEGSVPTFDPLGASDSRVDTPSINMYNALLQSKPGTTEIEPDLATEYAAGEDGLSFTFKLRPGVKFHDGSELTADDVVYTVERMLALKKGYYSSLMQVTGAEAVDDYTVKINTATPFPGLPDALARLYIVNADVIKQHVEANDYGEKWLQDHEAGSGPYMLESFEPEQQFTMVKFADYYKGWEGSHADKVIFRVFKEEATRRLALENKEVDWITVSSADTYKAIEGMEGITTYSDPTLNQLYFAFFTRNEYLKDVRIRKALSLAYDYVGHVELARQGFANIARGPLPPAIPCFDESMTESAMDLEQAKALMAEAGYPDGGFELDMAYQGTADEEVKAFQIMADGAAQLGITLKPMAVEWPAKVDAYSKEETAPAVGTVWMYPSYPDANEFLYLLGSSEVFGQYNFAWFENARFDELVKAGQSELDPAKRCEIYKEAQKIWMDETPYANVVVGQALAASRDYVEGYIWTPSHSFAQNVYVMSVDGKY